MSLPLACFSALFCVFSRTFLNLVDRVIFGQRKIDFCSALFWNAMHPFAIALFFCSLSSSIDGSLFLEPVCIYNGLAAQLTAASFSLAFRFMPIRSVVASAKVADFLIPLACFSITQKLSSTSLIFNQLSACAFFPLGYLAIKQKTIHFSAASFLIGCLLIQGALSSAFQIPEKSSSFAGFSQLILAILGWRTIFAAIPLFFSKLTFESENLSLKSISTLFIRGVLAYLSQASFFFCILFDHSFLAWPILNASPLFACCAAAVFLKEEIGSVELRSALGLCIIFGFYIFIHWRN